MVTAPPLLMARASAPAPPRCGLKRDGGGNGRVYHISFTASDDHSNSCSGEVLVGVPKNQGNKGAPVDDGALYDSTDP